MTIQYDNLDTSISAVGSASNIPIVFRTKGTSALDLSAGSSGINISNGNTVTALTRTATGTNYTSIPTLTISAPTTAGGVQATASARMQTQTDPTVVSGGTGYTVNDVLTVVGGTGSAATFTVSTVSGGVITAATRTGAGDYSVLPTNPVSVTGGTGNGATFNITAWQLHSSVGTITNAGSGYVEQPTVTFSGGGGSGATAYATVGSNTRVTSIGANLEFATAAGVGFRVSNSGTANVNFVSAQGNVSGGAVYLGAVGTDTDIAMQLTSKTAGAVRFMTNNTAQEQMRVAHTASAVNYVQVTGAATTGTPVISAQGSDTNVNIAMVSKGTGSIRFFTNGVVSEHFRIIHTAGTIVNYATVTGNVSGSAPIFSVAGTDTNIDLALTPKGTGRVRFGTYTATVSTITGYIEILDSGGTVRRLAVVL